MGKSAGRADGRPLEEAGLPGEMVTAQHGYAELLCSIAVWLLGEGAPEVRLLRLGQEPLGLALLGTGSGNHDRALISQLSAASRSPPTWERRC